MDNSFYRILFPPFRQLRITASAPVYTRGNIKVETMRGPCGESQWWYSYLQDAMTRVSLMPLQSDQTAPMCIFPGFGQGIGFWQETGRTSSGRVGSVMVAISSLGDWFWLLKSIHWTSFSQVPWTKITTE